MVNYLLQAGANARAIDAQGNTPLHYAALKGRTNALDMVSHRPVFVLKPKADAIPIIRSCL